MENDSKGVGPRDGILDRRTYLTLCGAGVATLAGCSTLTDHEFSASRISHPYSSAQSLGYEETAVDEIIINTLLHVQS